VTGPGHPDNKITHEILVERARHWLENTAAAKVVLTEFPGGSVGGSRRARRSNREVPDAIGWLSSGVSLLIECKATRADFLSDATKPSREKGSGNDVGNAKGSTRSGRAVKPPRKTEGLGAYRFYLTPSGLLAPGELPEGWGLLELWVSTGASEQSASGSKRYAVKRTHDPAGVFDARTGKPRRGLPDTRTRGTLQKENGLALSALRLVQLRDLHGRELSPSQSVYRNLGYSKRA
jgi:hypothetical protein